ncbi:hypothetical protein D1007_29261 [Hordeum vulgare]|nr:hypothetical protein D1007_29261 [Hordeum vulgare]
MRREDSSGGLAKRASGFKIRIMCFVQAIQLKEITISYLLNHHSKLGCHTYQILEEEDIAAARVGEKRVAPADPVGTDEQVSEKRVPGAGTAAKMKPRKEAKKPKKTGDAMVEVMQQYMNINKKQAEDEIALLTKESAGSTNGLEFSISRCISLVHKMGDIARHERARAYKVFKNVENRETFITSASEDEASAVEWLRSEMYELAT